MVLLVNLYSSYSIYTARPINNICLKKGEAMSLQTLLKEKLSQVNNLDEKWIIMVHDHIEHIKDNSFQVEVTDADKDRYMFKFDHFLRDNNCNINIMWIAKLINGIINYDDFTTRQYILIPDQTYISTLFRLYKTSTNLT